MCYPDPLMMNDGTPVRTPEQWYSQRRAELKRLIQDHMLGELPPPTTVSPSVLFADDRYLDGAATLTEIRLDIGPPRDKPVHLLMAVPNDRPAPVFVTLNAHTNHVLTDDPRVAIPDVMVRKIGKITHAREDARNSKPGLAPLDEIVRRRYAAAVFSVSEVATDEMGGKHPQTPWYHQVNGRSPDDPQNCGTIGAWVWGTMRVIDYLQTDRRVDPGKIAVVGQSRRGKTALFAGAYDERIALTIPSQSGTGGAAPTRGSVGEALSDMLAKFPHWFCPAFQTYEQDPERLPFDQHAVIALVAPRNVLLTTAREDHWTDPAGQFEMLVEADKVFRFLGLEGLATTERPPVGELLASRLGYHMREGKHSMTREDWQVFMDYADRWMGAGSRGKPRG